MKVVLCAINSQYIHSNPALFSLARAIEVLKEPQLLLRHYSINLPYETIISELYKERPEIAAFSTYIWNIDLVERLLTDLGQLLPHTLLLVGGPEATGRPIDLLKRCPALHGVLLGEGELLWPALLKRLLQGEQKPMLPGLLWRGQELVAEEAPQPDLCDLPFLYSAQDLEHLASARHIIYYEASRGCPYSCSFCASAQTKLRERPLELVLQELPLLAQTGSQIKFVDRTFNAHPTRAAAITRKVLELYRTDLSWHFEISPYNLSQELLDLWGKAPPGYIRLEAGVQSLHQPTLSAIRRSGEWVQAKQALCKIIARDNVHVHTDLIAGLPEEDLGTFAAAFTELHALAPHYLQLGFLKILPGSPLSREAVERGLVYSKYPPYQILQTPTMSANELFELKRVAKALNIFYNSGHFRQSLLKAAKLWPGGVLALYARLAHVMASSGAGGLSLKSKAELLSALLLPLDKHLFLDLLRLDWLCYQDNQPLPPALRRGDDGKQGYTFYSSWCFNREGQIEQNDGPAVLRFDWRHRNGVNSRAEIIYHENLNPML
ncbi:MAG: B12-binding domain-containing radical SAM protein [Clostridiales bacterium]|nr:B12-binding domain-containing radical SAM protein [Clostridiales bacterium]